MFKQEDQPPSQPDIPTCLAQALNLQRTLDTANNRNVRYTQENLNEFAQLHKMIRGATVSAGRPTWRRPQRTSLFQSYSCNPTGPGLQRAEDNGPLGDFHE